MKHIKQIIFLFLFFLSLIPVYSQEFGTGAILDPVRYNQIKTKPILITRGGDVKSVLPRKVSIIQYSPKPESQGNSGTCVAWSTTFAARTISESYAISRTNPQQITSNAFSPFYTYKNSSNDPTFKEGMTISGALNFLKEKGAVRRLPTEISTEYGIVEIWMNIPLSLYANLTHYKILDYTTLFHYNNDSYNGLTMEQKVLPVKTSLANNYPVIIAFEIYYSFKEAYGKMLWEPIRGQSISGYHAMCVIGYDDDLYGGAFLIQNSWGVNWGTGGLIWIRYRDFAQYVYEAYEIQEDLNNYRNSSLVAANIEIEVKNDPKGMPVIFDEQQGFYKTLSSYPSGTKFRFLMTNYAPAYVYAFATDSNDSSLDRIYPNQYETPILNYVGTTIAWPSEGLEPGKSDLIELYGDPDITYLVVLYSKSELDIDAIEKNYVNARGTLHERVTQAVRAVGSELIPYSNVKKEINKIEFSTTSMNPKAVFGLLLAIEHR